jgi:molecular chaperone HscA
MQIEEPIKINESEDNKNQSLSIGIDFGTTNCVASYVYDKKIETIEFDGHGDLLPSYISISENGDIKIGKESLNQSNISNVISVKSIKRFIGQRDHKINIFNKEYGITELSSMIFHKIKKTAENQLESPVDSCVITVPAKFDDYQKNEVKVAAEIAGFNVKRIINEPTAAALAYGVENKSEGIYMVYDLGGGTFDVSILSMKMGIFRVISTSGDSNLGGDDIDSTIKDYLVKKYKLQDDKNEILYIAKNIKEYLSSHENFTGSFIFNKKNIKIEFTAKEIEFLSEKFIKKTIECMADALSVSNLSKSDILGIILVGGSTRMPVVQKSIKQYIDCEIFTNLDPDKIVGIGAGIKAAGKSSGFENILLDICPLSLGVEIMGGLTEKIIHRNTPIPCSAIQNFTTGQDGQTGMILKIVQGERELAKDCRELGILKLANIDPKPAGMTKIEVKFSIDVDGILSVTARDTETENSITTEIKPTYGIDYHEMSEMLISSIQNAKNDMNSRLLIEAKESAKTNIFALEKAIKNNGDIISIEYLEKIEGKISDLELSLESSDRDLIEKINLELDKIAEEFLESITNLELNKLISGKNINDEIKI